MQCSSISTFERGEGVMGSHVPTKTSAHRSSLAARVESRGNVARQGTRINNLRLERFSGEEKQ